MPRSDITLLGAAEIGARLRLSKTRTTVIINRKGFPEPQATLAMGKVWLGADVEAWIAEHRPHLDEAEES
jgi:prophage regulatory protein